MGAIQQVLLGYGAAGGGGLSLAATIIALTPWGYWKLNETTLTTAIDYSGNARDGTYAGSGASAVAGLFSGSSGAISMAGSARVNLPNFTVAANQKISIIAFIKTAAATNQHFLSADDNVGAQRRWQYRSSSSGTFQEMIVLGGATPPGVAPPNLNNNAGRMIGMTFDPVAATCVFYLDGALNNSSASGAAISTGSARPAIGSRSNQLQAEGFNGTIDNVAMWVGTILSGSDMSAIWAARNTP